MDWLRENFSFALAILGGTFISILSIDTHSITEALSRIVCGLFCGYFFTDPILVWQALDPETYKEGIAALLAMSGYGLAKIVTNFKLADLFKVVNMIRGK